MYIDENIFNQMKIKQWPDGLWNENIFKIYTFYSGNIHNDFG